MTSLLDPLTGVASWRAFWHCLESALADEVDEGVAVILLDVADFSEFNRTLGVDAGNLLLQTSPGVARRTSAIPGTLWRASAAMSSR